MLDIKQKAIHEGQEFAGISLYLAFFFCAVVAYSTVLLGKFQVSYFSYGSALINALVIAKVILIGEYAHLGKKQEGRPLVLSALYKAFLFTLLVFGFHVVEEVIKQLAHGDTIASALHEIRLDTLICRNLIVFSTFIPLFAFRELQRVLGEDNFRSLFFRTGAMSKSDAV
jgi:H+/gluconate symporter-like permease